MSALGRLTYGNPDTVIGQEPFMRKSRPTSTAAFRTMAAHRVSGGYSAKPPVGKAVVTGGTRAERELEKRPVLLKRAIGP